MQTVISKSILYVAPLFEKNAMSIVRPFLLRSMGDLAGTVLASLISMTIEIRARHVVQRDVPTWISWFRQAAKRRRLGAECSSSPVVFCKNLRGTVRDVRKTLSALIKLFLINTLHHRSLIGHTPSRLWGSVGSFYLPYQAPV